MPTEDAFLKVADEPAQRALNVGPGAGSIDQDQVIADALAGDRKAIALLIETCTDVVFGFLSRRIDRQDVVEELCQEVFLAAWPQLERFRQDASLTTWLCAIARHKVADFYRSRLQEIPQESAEEQDRVANPEAFQIVDFDACIDTQRTDEKIRDILSQMPERHRSILRWRYWDHRSLAEIAGMTGKSEKATERLLARSRENFARIWNRD